MATRIDYAAVLADLEAHREMLDAAISAIKALQQPAPKPKIGRPLKPAPAVPSNPGKQVPQPGDLDYEEPDETQKAHRVRSTRTSEAK